jgi:hypothetical protein
MSAKKNPDQLSSKEQRKKELFVSIGRSVIEHYSEFCDREGLDDAEYIPTVKVIIEGLESAMVEQKMDDKDRLAVRDDLLSFCRNMYTEGWLSNAVEDAEGRRVDMKGERKAAEYYFDYVYEHGEHPR